MPDKLLFIESNTTGTGMLALQKATALGLQPIFITNDARRYRGLAETGCPVYTCDTNRLETLQATIADLVPYAEMRGITTTSEFYVEVVAALVTRYGLPGNTPSAIKSARNKALTRQILERAGILQPRFAIVNSVAEVAGAIEEIGLPCVIKPVDDSASNNVLLCQTREQAERQVARILAVRVNVRGQAAADMVLVEEYLEAAEFSVEMLTWQGKTTCIGITRKSLTGFPYFVEAGHLFPADLPVEQADQMRLTVLRTLSALDWRNGATHTEVKWTPQGCAILEVNARLAGGMIPELIRLVTGIDMLEQQIRCAIDGPTSFQVEPMGVAGIQFLMADRPGVLCGFESLKKVAQVTDVVALKITAQAGDLVQPPQNAYSRLGYIIAHSASNALVIKSLQEAARQIHIRIENKKDA